jgi:hypothetical protein
MGGEDEKQEWIDSATPKHEEMRAALTEQKPPPKPKPAAKAKSKPADGDSAKKE